MKNFMEDKWFLLTLLLIYLVWVFKPEVMSYFGYEVAENNIQIEDQRVLNKESEKNEIIVGSLAKENQGSKDKCQEEKSIFEIISIIIIALLFLIYFYLLHRAAGGIKGIYPTNE